MLTIPSAKDQGDISNVNNADVEVSNVNDAEVDDILKLTILMSMMLMSMILMLTIKV